MKKFNLDPSDAGSVLRMTGMGALIVMAAFAAAPAPSWAESGVNISGESGVEMERGTNVSGESVTQRRRLLNEEVIPVPTNLPYPQDPNMRIDVPRMPDGRPWRPVRQLSSNERRELEDIEFRFQQGQMSEFEYYQRRNAIMERLGLDPEY